MIRNPKQEGTNLFDCIPQCGPCSIGCNQCFYNRPGAYYIPIDEPSIPTVEEVGDGIVRMNCGNDSNLERELVIKTASQYKHAFFNTSLPFFDFPGPVVFTANRNEEEPATLPEDFDPDALKNLMFVRLRVSATNLPHIDKAVTAWTSAHIPVVLTFMAYYTENPYKDPSALGTLVDDELWDALGENPYVWKVRHINSYWCPKPQFIEYVMGYFAGEPLVSLCGAVNSGYCKDCLNCQTRYYLTAKHLRGE